MENIVILLGMILAALVAIFGALVFKIIMDAERKNNGENSTKSFDN